MMKRLVLFHQAVRRGENKRGEVGNVAYVTFSVSLACSLEVNSVVWVNTRVPSGLRPSASRLSSSSSDYRSGVV
jgi:hypothetical protein